MQISVGQQSQETRALHGGAQLTLEACLGAGDASRDQLAVFGDEFLQDVHILVIDFGDFFYCEAAELTTLEQIVASWTLLVIFLFVWAAMMFPYSKIMSLMCKISCLLRILC